MPEMPETGSTTLTFLGTGNYLAPGERYWNSFVVTSGVSTVLVEPSPTALPNLRRAGYSTASLDAVVLSHFHPDHTFGWPFLLLDVAWSDRSNPLQVVGPPGTEDFLAEMMDLGAVSSITKEAEEAVGLVFVEGDPDAGWQHAGPVSFRPVEVDHVADLTCFGYLFSTEAGVIGYSGDTKPCDGLEALATAADVLVLECNGRHRSKSHMDAASVRSLRERHPDLVMIATHLGPEITAEDLPGVRLPDDFERIEL